MTTQTSHPAARRRYELEGPDAFGDIELLALLLGNTGAGTPTATEIAADLIQLFGSLPEVARLEPIELRRIRGIGRERSVRLHAALQLGRRALVRDLLAEPIVSPNLAWDQFRPRMRGLVDEQLHACSSIAAAAPWPSDASLEEATASPSWTPARSSAWPWSSEPPASSLRTTIPRAVPPPRSTIGRSRGAWLGPATSWASDSWITSSSDTRATAPWPRRVSWTSFWPRTSATDPRSDDAARAGWAAR